ncbi:MAG TPA: 50S ribosomal protein L9 [Candidatus Krumholzibacteria bacterium]|nr:50S ribosomal protein L9 [Candidatus Krumholzibacteria bacterium]
MDVILMQNVENLGPMGKTVNVAAGYARNYLIPKGLAVPATAGQRKLVEQHLKNEAKKDQERKVAAQALAASLGALSCTISGRADEEGQLYGSVGARDIAAALNSDKLAVDHHMIVMGEPLKNVGEHTVELRLHHEVRVEVKVQVVGA